MPARPTTFTYKQLLVIVERLDDCIAFTSDDDEYFPELCATHRVALDALKCAPDNPDNQ